MEFRYIPVNQLRQWWPTVRPGLDEVKKYSPEDWIVEDIYTDCFNQKAMLWVGLDNNQLKSFFVLQAMGDTMHIWAAWTLENNYQVVESSLKYIKDICSQGNVKYLTFSSHRKGWQRRAKQLGFSPKLWICEV